jgi:hypothetical protein
MARQNIELGTAPSGVGGDTPRSANIKINANFSELYNAPAINSLRVLAGATYGSGQGGYTGWNDAGDGSGFSGHMAFTCNRGGGSGGFSWRSVLSDNSAGGPPMTYSYGGVLSVPSGIQLGGADIVSRGSNTNGDFVRYADGTQICWLRNLGFGPTSGTASGFWTPPAAFLGNQATVLASLAFAETTDNFTCSRLSANLGTNGAVTVTANFSVSQVYRISLMAIGRWK